MKNVVLYRLLRDCEGVGEKTVYKPDWYQVEISNLFNSE